MFLFINPFVPKCKDLVNIINVNDQATPHNEGNNIACQGAKSVSFPPVFCNNFQLSCVALLACVCTYVCMS